MRAQKLIFIGLFTLGASAALAQGKPQEAGVSGDGGTTTTVQVPNPPQPQQGQQGQQVQQGQSTTTSQRQGAAGQQAERVMVLPHELAWKEAPPTLPAGAELAVLNGDPSKEGPFTVRLRFPDGYRVAAHTHPVDENLTVISGTFHIGYGAKFDQSRGTALPAGSFMRMNANVQHYAWAAGETIIQIHGSGPWSLTYVNPNDDPTRATSQAR